MPRDETTEPTTIIGELKRRGIIKFGTLAAALTGASTLSGLVAGSAHAAPGTDKNPSASYIPSAEKGAASGVATLDSGSRLLLSQIPDLSATTVLAGEEWINVKKYAATNSLDFTSALEQALAASRNVTIPPGSYNISRRITLSSNHRLVGGGGKNAAKIVAPADWDAAAHPSIIQMTGTNASIEHIVIDARLTTTPDVVRVEADYEPYIGHTQILGGFHGINLLRGLEARFEHVSVKDCTGAGAYVQNVPDSFWLDVSTDNCLHGFRATGGSITAVHVHAIKSISHGFYLVGPGSSQFYGCHADTSGNNGFHITTPNNARFTDCWSFKNGRAGGTNHNWLISGAVETSLIGCSSNNEGNVSNAYNFVGTQTGLSLIACTATSKGVTGSTAGIEFIGCSGFLAQFNTAAKVARSTSGALLDATKTVVQGDSLTECFDSKQTASFRSSWFMNACLASEGTMRPHWNAARGGHTSSQLRELFDSEVLAQNPTLVGLMPGRNDGLVGGVPQNMIDYVTEAVAKCRAKGIGAFLVNTVPQGQAAISAPTLTAEFCSSTGGSLPAGTHRFLVTAGNGSVTTQTGETLPSAPASVTTPTSTYSVRLYWTHVPGANWYKVYKETSDGSGVYGLVGTVAPSAAPAFLGTCRFIQTAAISPGVRPPTSNTTAYPTSAASERAKNNAWLASFAARESVPLVDVYSELVDSDTGMWKTGLTYDGTHPNGEANAIIGKKVWATLAPLTKPAPPIIATSARDPLNLVSNGTFLNGDAHFPTGFAAVTSPSYDGAKVTNTRARRNGFAGYALTAMATVPVVQTTTGPLVSTGFVAGNRLIFSARVEAQLARGGGSFAVSIKDQAGNQIVEFKHIAIDIAPSTITKDFTVPSGVTGLRLELQLVGVGPVSVGQFTLYNLTAESYLA